jgi:hypothetical protein
MRKPRLPHKHGRWVVLAVLAVVALGVHLRAGQQNVEFKGGIPVAPSGLAGHKLPAKPGRVRYR